MRGEQMNFLTCGALIIGSPPHARGTVCGRPETRPPFTDHPRMRGEQPSISAPQKGQ